MSRPFGGNTARRDWFLQKVDILIDQLREINDNSDIDLQQYDWLSSTVSEWQFVLSSILGVSKDIPILKPPQNVGKATVSDSDVQNHLERRAFKIFEDRVKQILMRRYSEEFYRLQTSSDAQRLEDFLNAKICFASDILTGEGKLWRQFSVEEAQEGRIWKLFSGAVFHRLHEVWLDDVIKFYAYLKWERRGAEALSETRGDYVDAREDMSRRIINKEIKFNHREAIDELLDYINSEYLSSHQIDFCKPGVL